MKITGVETYYFEYPLPRDFFPAWIPGHTQTHNRCIILKLLAEEGLTGISATSVFNEGQARLGKMIVEETIGQFLIGLDIAEVGVVTKLMNMYGYMLGGRPWSVEIALWDLIGKAAGQPLWRHWGASSGALPLYASTGETVDAERSPAQALAAREAGFTAIKLRAHHWSIDEDIAAIRAVRDAVGPAMEILIDANQGWTLSPIGPEWDLDTAKRFADAMAELNAYWIEEPLHRFDYDGLAALRAYSKVRIAGGEMNQGAHEFKTLFEKDCLDVYQPDAVLAGGVTLAREVAAQAKEKGKLFAPHTWTTGVGFAVNAHLAAASGICPYLEFPYEPESWSPEARDAMLTKPFLPDGGRIELSNAPGLGIELNEEAMKRHAIRL